MSDRLIVKNHWSWTESTDSWDGIDPTVDWNNHAWLSITHTISRNLNITSSLPRVFVATRTISTGFSISSQFSHGIQQNQNRTIDFVPLLASGGEYNHNHQRSINFSVVLRHLFVKNIQNTINFVSTDYKSIGKNIDVSFSIVDKPINQITKIISESFRITRREERLFRSGNQIVHTISGGFHIEQSKFSHEIAHINKENLTIYDKDMKHIQRNDPPRFIGFLSNFTHGVTQINKENLNISERLINHVTKLTKTEFSIESSLVRKGGGTLSDVKLFNEEMTLNEFVELARRDQILGYSLFMPFSPGDERYEDAKYRLGVRVSKLTDDRIGLSELLLMVDVEDIIDRGSDNIPVGGLTIYYNRSFNAAPSVAVGIKNSTASNPVQKVTGITDTKFDVELIDGDNPPTSVAGSIDWVAMGY